MPPIGEFHILIAEMTRNGALPLVVAQSVGPARRARSLPGSKSHFHTPALRAKTLTDHEAIVAALEAHDVDGAREAMHRHLRRVAREFQRRWDETGGGKSGDSRRARSRAGDELTGESAGGRVATHRAGAAPRHQPTRVAKRIEHGEASALARACTTWRWFMSTKERTTNDMRRRGA